MFSWIKAHAENYGNEMADRLAKDAVRIDGTNHTRSVRKVSDRIFVCEHLMEYNLERLHEPTLNLSAHA